MKLKAPRGVGNPSVAGVTVVPRNGVYEVEAEIGALLIESFGFVEIAADATAKVKVAVAPWSGKPLTLKN